jgi:hypothetical protein
MDDVPGAEAREKLEFVRVDNSNLSNGIFLENTSELVLDGEF